MAKDWAHRLTIAARVVLAAALIAVTAAPAQAFVFHPRWESLAYRRAWALQVIGADAAYKAGYTGRGVRVALIDCGLRHPTHELRRNISRESGDVIGQRLQPIDDNHGSRVAAPLGSALNTMGLVGMAYNATMIEVRADMDGGYKGACAFWPKDLARALDYAVAHNARVILLPLQAQHRLGDEFEAALGRAVQSGAVIVAAAGNDGQSDTPAYPAMYAADPRFAGSMLVAGAATYKGERADWSDRAGPTQARYLLAPGEWVLTDCRDLCDVVSGTSYAAPYVAGAVALMMEAHPDLSGPQIADKVLAATRDMGPPGTDDVYGHGMLDLSHAFEPRSAQR